MAEEKALTPVQQAKLQLLEESLGVYPTEDADALESTKGPPSALCASLKREEQLQYRFMVTYQALVLALAVMVLALLAFAAYRIVDSAPFQGVIAGAGALISGTAAGFLIKQRADARDEHAAAQKGLAKYRCP